MTKWEYRSIPSGGHCGPAMEELGEEGWELVSVDNGVAYFRRRKTTVQVQVGPTEHKEVPYV